MPLPNRGLVDLDGLTVERLGLLIPAHVPQQEREIVEADGIVRMPLPNRGLAISMA